MFVVTSAPVISEGNVIGVVAGRASLESLNNIMVEKPVLATPAKPTLVGSNHLLLTGLLDANYVIPETYIGTKGADAAVVKHLSGFDTYLNYNGKTVIGVYRWLPDLQVASWRRKNRVKPSGNQHRLDDHRRSHSGRGYTCHLDSFVSYAEYCKAII